MDRNIVLNFVESHHRSEWLMLELSARLSKVNESTKQEWEDLLRQKQRGEYELFKGLLSMPGVCAESRVQRIVPESTLQPSERSAFDVPPRT